MTRPLTYNLMWRGVCFAVAPRDVRTLVQAGMVVRKLGRDEEYVGLVTSTNEHMTPADALRWLQQRAGGTGAASASTTRAATFWRPPAGRKRAAPGDAGDSRRRRSGIR